MAWDKNEGVRGFRLPSAFGGGGGGAGPAPVAQAPTATGVSDSVWQPGSGFRNTGAFRERALQTAQLGAQAAEVGEPTSFRAGAGAPEPIAIMRGGATTFSPGRLPGQQFAQPEMATPLEAGQAWNRGVRGEAVAAGDRRGFTTPEATLDTQYGGFRAPGQTLEEAKGAHQIAASAALTKRPDLVAAAKIAEEKQAQIVKDKVGTDFEGRALKRWGVYKDGKLARPAEEHVLRDLDEAKEYAMEQGNPQAGHNYMEWSQRLRQMYPDVYATTMKTNPLAWRDIVITHGPQIPATATTAPAAAATFTEPQRVTAGLSSFSVGP